MTSSIRIVRASVPAQVEATVARALEKVPADRFSSMQHFKRALEGALELHRGYPANKPVLAGKQGAPTPYKTPVNIPT